MGTLQPKSTSKTATVEMGKIGVTRNAHKLDRYSVLDFVFG